MEPIEIQAWMLASGGGLILFLIHLLTIIHIHHRITGTRNIAKSTARKLRDQNSELLEKIRLLKLENDFLKDHLDTETNKLHSAVIKTGDQTEQAKNQLCEQLAAIQTQLIQTTEQSSRQAAVVTADLAAFQKKLIELEEKTAKLILPKQHTETFGEAFRRTRTPTIKNGRAEQSFQKLTAEQQTCINLIRAGVKILLVTGRAGTGKSTLIQHLSAITTKNCAIIAPTGIAARNVNGQTIHSFFNLPPKPLAPGNIKQIRPDTAENEQQKQILEKRLKTLQKLELLIIDEISMVRVDIMNAINLTLQKNRNSSEPFGGVQVVMFGDLFQLPAFARSIRSHGQTRTELEVLQDSYPERMQFVGAPSLDHVPFTHITLTYPFRQTDPGFIEILNSLRVGHNISLSLDRLHKRCSIINPPPESSVTLTARNRTANHINNARLNLINSPLKEITAQITGNYPPAEYPTEKTIRLKVGARVMLLINNGDIYRNGSMGTVEEIKQQTIHILLDPEKDKNPQSVSIDLHTWERFDFVYDKASDSIIEDRIGTFCQFPLRLAWAVTIHKSQGQTINAIHVDLDEGAFTTGQVYTALSRCPTPEGITLAREITTGEILTDKEMAELMRPLSNI